MSNEQEKAAYKITGLVDIFDEQGLITGQYPIGSVQMLTIARGTAAVEAGQAEEATEEESDEAVDSTGATGEEEVEETLDEDDENETGATGEEEVE